MKSATVNSRVTACFSHPDLGYRQFLLQNLVLKDSAYCWRINLDIFYRMAPNIIAFPVLSN